MLKRGSASRVTPNSTLVRIGSGPVRGMRFLAGAAWQRGTFAAGKFGPSRLFDQRLLM